MQNYITIKEPCHENWDQMSVSEKGRFCASCKKHVQDFTNSSVIEIKTAYQENNGSLCGRISAKQLREQYVQEQIQKNHSGYLRKFFFATLFCFGASLFTLDSAKANTLQNLKQSFFHVFSKVETDTITIKGKVTDKDSKETIPFALVSLSNKDSIIYKTTTDFDGNYNFKITNSSFTSVDIEVMCVGYTNQKVKNISLTVNRQ